MRLPRSLPPVLACCLISPAIAEAQSTADSPPQATLICSSVNATPQHCAAHTAAGVLLVRSVGPGACLLGTTWGYDETGVWVSDGCSGEFTVAQTTPEVPSAPATPPDATPEPIETWGEFDPGKGFLIGRSSIGQLEISGYALVRYVNQLPAQQRFTDHLGNERLVDTRNDIFSHRIIVYLKGWIGVPKLLYAVVLWTVNTTDQDAIFGNVGYQFSRAFSIYAGINGTPGTRSLQGSHPYWLGHDRVMADEFFRPYFTYGTWAQGEPVPGLWYNVMVGNNSSALGITAAQLDRELSAGGSMWWMPTTREFGPRGGFGDWEMHEEVATRFGVSAVESREQRYNAEGPSDNTTLKLVDSVNLFETGALAHGVTIQQADYRLLSVDAGLKYRGIFIQTEIYTRWLDGFIADGPVPVSSIVDKGFYVQGAFYPIPRKLELYAATSRIFGDDDAGFGESAEYLAGMNLYPADTRNHRLNLQVIDVHDSPVGSTFGYYTGGQSGTTVSAAFSVFF